MMPVQAHCPCCMAAPLLLSNFHMLLLSWMCAQHTVLHIFVALHTTANQCWCTNNAILHLSIHRTCQLTCDTMKCNTGANRSCMQLCQLEYQVSTVLGLVDG